MNTDTFGNGYERRYRQCRAGFSFWAVSTALLAIDSAVFITFLLTFRQDIFQIVGGTTWRLIFGAGIAFAALLGSTLIAGLWTEANWGNRTKSMVGLSIVGVVIWFLRNLKAFGLVEPSPGQDLLLMHAAFATRWVQFGLLASLAADVAEHLGNRTASDIRNFVLAMTGLGMVTWILLVLEHSPLIWVLWLGVATLRGLTAFLLTGLCLLASRECTRLLRELRHEKQGTHLFGLPHENPWSEDRGSHS